MDNLKYKHLFPFENVPVNSKILIYGAGTLGQDYYTQISITHYCEIIGFVDKNFDKYSNSIISVYSPDDIEKLSFDYVIVALRMKAAFNEIKRILLDAGVAENKIIAVFEREYDEIDILSSGNKESVNTERMEYSYEESIESIAILTTGGFGDMVIQKRVITEIACLAPDCSIDIYNIKAFDFLKTLYQDVSNVKNIIPDLGSQFMKLFGKYSLALTMEACHFVTVNHFDEVSWREQNGDFAARIRLLMDRTREEAASIQMPVHVTLYRRWLKGYNAYSGFNYDGVFEIFDKNVNIPLSSLAENDYLELRETWRSSKYITINYGNGDCADATKVAKSWPLEYFETLTSMIGNEFPDLCIVQLGSKDAHHIAHCDEYVLGKDFPIVEHILKNSYLHIDIEGGLVHIASQLGTKCVVLFGPTVLEYYGYDNNINIRAGNCHNCWGLYTDVNKCARGLKEPECMYSITPDIVFGYVKEELDKNEY